jgi:hypothetical protein
MPVAFEHFLFTNQTVILGPWSMARHAYGEGDNHDFFQAMLTVPSPANTALQALILIP